MMLTKIHKWGASLGLRIHETLASDAGVEAGSIVDLTVDGGQLIVKPVRQAALRLEDLVAQITEDNRHNEIPAQETRGREAW